jgi:hypothetical protein
MKKTERILTTAYSSKYTISTTLPSHPDGILQKENLFSKRPDHERTHQEIVDGRRGTTRDGCCNGRRRALGRQIWLRAVELGAMAVVSQWTTAATSSVEAAGGGFLSRLRVDRAVDEQGRCSEGGQEKWRANGARARENAAPTGKRCQIGAELVAKVFFNKFS